MCFLDCAINMTIIAKVYEGLIVKMILILSILNSCLQFTKYLPSECLKIMLSIMPYPLQHPLICITRIASQILNMLQQLVTAAVIIVRAVSTFAAASVGHLPKHAQCLCSFMFFMFFMFFMITFYYFSDFFLALINLLSK